MKRGHKRVLLLLAWAASLLVSNVAGGIVGFGQGMATQLGMSGSEAFTTAVVLRELRSGNSDRALRLLEVKLDGLIAQAVFGGRAYDSPYNVVRFVFPDQPQQNSWFLSKVLEYREKHPPVVGDALFREKLMEKLEAYRGTPRPSMSGGGRDAAAVGGS
jgi:hypothetical protein